jgi:hypothetical protein
LSSFPNSFQVEIVQPKTRIRASWSHFVAGALRVFGAQPETERRSDRGVGPMHGINEIHGKVASAPQPLATLFFAKQPVRNINSFNPNRKE